MAKKRNKKSDPRTWEGADVLRCGECGRAEHVLFNIHPKVGGDRHSIGRLIAQCTGCQSVTEITMRIEAKVSNVWGNGTLCGGWGPEQET